MAHRAPRLSSLSTRLASNSPPTYPHPPSLPHDRRLSQGSQVPPRRTPILKAKDTRIAEVPSADTTNTDHLENPVGPRRTRRVQPIAGLEHVYVGRNFTVYGTYQALVRTLLCFPSVLDFPPSILHFPLLLSISTFSPPPRRHATAFAFAPSFTPLLSYN